MTISFSYIQYYLVSWIVTNNIQSHYLWSDHKHSSSHIPGHHIHDHIQNSQWMHTEIFSYSGISNESEKTVTEMLKEVYFWTAPFQFSIQLITPWWFRRITINYNTFHTYRLVICYFNGQLSITVSIFYNKTSLELRLFYWK